MRCSNCGSENNVLVNGVCIACRLMAEEHAPEIARLRDEVDALRCENLRLWSIIWAADEHGYNMKCFAEGEWRKQGPADPDALKAAMEKPGHHGEGPI